MSLFACNMSMKKWVNERVQAEEKWRVATTCISVCMRTKGCMHADCQHASGLTCAGCAAYLARWLVASQVVPKAPGARCQMALHGCWLIHLILIYQWHWVPEICNPLVFFTPLEYEVKSIFLSLELLMGLKSYALGLWAQICSYNTETHKPIAF